MRQSTSIKFKDELSKHKVKCKCGHTMILINVPSDICTWCGNKVYRSKKDEFDDKIKKIVKKNNEIEKEKKL